MAREVCGRRYLRGFEVYAARVGPLEHANIVINNNMDTPKIAVNPNGFRGQTGTK
jgi:hypothetical protein